MKNYNNYNNNLNNEEYKKFLLGFSYIDEYSPEIKDGLNILKIENINSFVKKTYKNLKHIELTYSSLFRFYIYAWLFKYKGSNKKVISIINSNDNLISRSINQMPYNLIVLSKVRKYVNINSTYEKDYKLLSEFISKKEQIINETNFIEWFDIIYLNTIKANKTEYDIQKAINNNKIANIKNARTVSSIMDKSGVDLIAEDENNNNKKIQVKRIAPNSRLVVEYKKNKTTGKNNYILAIYKTQLDLRNYTAGKDSFNYDYLYLYVDKGRKKIIVIDIESIKTIRIFKTEKDRIVYINIKDNVTEENVQQYLKSYYI